jgi:hypothetical protein
MAIKSPPRRRGRRAADSHHLALPACGLPVPTQIRRGLGCPARRLAGPGAPPPPLARTVQRRTGQRHTDITAIRQHDAKYADSLSRPPYIFAETRSAKARHLNADAPIMCGLLAERYALVTV